MNAEIVRRAGLVEGCIAVGAAARDSGWPGAPRRIRPWTVERVDARESARRAVAAEADRRGDEHHGQREADPEVRRGEEAPGGERGRRREGDAPGRVRGECLATIGEVGNAEHELESWGKAGKTRWKGRRPKVRGEVMNPVDHPHGGRTRGGRNVVSPWGKKEGVKTRNKKKSSQRMIVRGRKRGKATQ